MPKKDPQRKCAVTNQVADRDVLLRFVLDPDGCVTFDSGKRLPGRGIWLTPHRDVLETAVKKNAFARAAKTPARVPGIWCQRWSSRSGKRSWTGWDWRDGLAL